MKQNVEIWHLRLSQLANSSKPCENSLFEDVFKVSTPSFHTSSNRSLLIKLSTALLMEFCGSLVDHPILFARLSTPRQWYLAWVEMSCSVQA